MVHAERQVRGPTEQCPGDIAAPGAAALPAILQLQQLAGNNAVARLVAQRDPQLPGTPPDPAEELRKNLGPAVERVLTETSKAADYDFAANLRDTMLATLKTADDATRSRATDIAKQAAEVSETVVDSAGNGVTFDIPALLAAFDGLYRDAAGIDGVTVSAGVRQVIRTLGADITSAVAEPAFSMVHVHNLHTGIATAGASLGDATALLRLELEGTITELIDLRSAYGSADSDAARAAAGKAIGVTSRKALLLDQALRKVAASSAPLDTEVERRAAEINGIRATAATEQATRTAMGDKLTLLAEQQVTIDHGDPGTVNPLGQNTDAIVEPDQAFPEATDVAERTAAGELGSRLGRQRTDLNSLRGKVVPESPTYEIDEFWAVHRRWFSLYSGAQEKQDPVVQMLLGLMGEPYRIAGADVGNVMSKVEGGIARAWLMNMAAEMMTSELGGGATNQFAGQIDGVKRQTGTTGTAGAMGYQFGEMYPGSSGLSNSGEADSRKQFQQARQQQTAAAVTNMSMLPEWLRPSAAEGAGLTKGAQVPIVGVKATGAREGWSYLTDVHAEPLGPLVAREQKVVPPEVAEYLMASQQRARTLAQPHIPMADGRALGSRPMRYKGAEAASATATARYVEGKASPSVPTEVANVQSELRAAGVPATIDRLRADLRKYLDAFFTKRANSGHRLAAIFAIGDVEHGISKKLVDMLKPEAIEKMLAEAIKVQAIITGLTMLGPLGEIASAGYQGYLGAQGISDIAALASILGFCRNASLAATLSAARAWGYMTVNIAEDSEQLFSTLVTKPVTAGLNHITKSPPSTPRELAQVVRSMMADPAAREIIMRDLDSRIAKAELTQQSSPDLAAMHALRDELTQRSTPEGAQAIDAPLPGAAGKGGDPADPSRPHGDPPRRAPDLLDLQQASALREQARQAEAKATEFETNAEREAKRGKPERAERIRGLAKIKRDEATALNSRAGEYSSGQRSARSELPDVKDFDDFFKADDDSIGDVARSGELSKIDLSPSERTPANIERLTRELLTSQNGGRVVYRVDGGKGRHLLTVDANSNVTVAKQTIHLNFGSPERAMEFLSKETKGGEGGRLVRFEVSEQWVQSLRSAAVPEKAGSLKEPQLVDVKYADDQMMVPAGMIHELQDFVIPGSAREVDIDSLKPPKPDK